MKSKLNVIRIYLTNAKLAQYKIDYDETDMIESDFVDMRQDDPSVTGETLNTLLVLTRLLTIARGKTALDEDTWELAKSYEEQRKARLAKMPASSI